MKVGKENPSLRQFTRVLSQIWEWLSSMRRSRLMLDQVLSTLLRDLLELAQEAVGRSTHMDRKASTGKEAMMEFDAIVVNALLDVIIKTKDTPGFQSLHNAAMEQLRQMIEAEVAKMEVPKAEKEEAA